MYSLFVDLIGLGGATPLDLQRVSARLQRPAALSNDDSTTIERHFLLANQARDASRRHRLPRGLA